MKFKSDKYFSFFIRKRSNKDDWFLVDVGIDESVSDGFVATYDNVHQPEIAPIKNFWTCNAIFIGTDEKPEDYTIKCIGQRKSPPQEYMVGDYAPYSYYINSDTLIAFFRKTGVKECTIKRFFG